MPCVYSMEIENSPSIGTRHIARKVPSNSPIERCEVLTTPSSQRATRRTGHHGHNHEDSTCPHARGMVMHARGVVQRTAIGSGPAVRHVHVEQCVGQSYQDRQPHTPQHTLEGTPTAVLPSHRVVVRFQGAQSPAYV